MNQIKLATASVGFIGVGNMGEALLSALLKAGAPAAKISFSERGTERSAQIVERYGVTSSTIAELSSQSDVLLIIVKPQDLETVLDAVRPTLKTDSLVISFLAGKRISTIEAGLGSQTSVVRVMPNTPTLLGAGMCIVSFGSFINDIQREYVRDFMKACGKFVELPEELQDAAAATSGSGPAYFFAFVEAMIAGATDMGIDEATATQLTIQTIVGAAKMLDESGKSATTLRENVTSPKGMTYEGLKVFAEADLNSLVAKAMKAAADRSREMA
jgi:pyrroline-5-carboxylate reductase